MQITRERCRCHCQTKAHHSTQAEGRGESTFVRRALSRGGIPGGGQGESVIKEAAAMAYIGSPILRTHTEHAVLRTHRCQ